MLNPAYAAIFDKTPIELTCLGGRALPGHDEGAYSAPQTL